MGVGHIYAHGGGRQQQGSSAGAQAPLPSQQQTSGESARGLSQEPMDLESQISLGDSSEAFSGSQAGDQSSEDSAYDRPKGSDVEFDETAEVDSESGLPDIDIQEPDSSDAGDDLYV